MPHHRSRDDVTKAERMKLEDRFRGCLLGLACGDAVGTTVEFRPRGSLSPVTDMVGGGPFALKAGQWTDDTSMALCLAESLLSRGGFDPADQMDRYVKWWHRGYLSSTGECFDIGNTTQQALSRYLATRDPYAGSTDRRAAGNGSLMRLAPVVLFYYPNKCECLKYAAASSRTTHAASEAVECCQALAQVLVQALSGADRRSVLPASLDDFREPAVRRLASMDYASLPRDTVKGSGYCIESLTAALWSFHTTSDFESAVLAAVNLGDDADTTAAICGQIAGAYYGVEGIPQHWRERLAMRDYIDETARGLFTHGRASAPAAAMSVGDE